MDFTCMNVRTEILFSSHNVIITVFSFIIADAYRTLHLLLDEYVNYVMEVLHTRIIEGQYNDVLKVHGSE